MTTEESSAQRRDNNKTTIEIAGADLRFCAFELDTDTPTGGKIAKVAGLTGNQHPYVLQWRLDGDLEDIRVHEEANLANGTQFIVAVSSSSNRITIDGEQFDWPADITSGAVIRKLGKVPADKAIYFERDDQPDRLIEDKDLIKIKKDGVEEFKSRTAHWEILVQGVLVKSKMPEISVVDALTQAGFDPNAWIIILKVAGQPKRQLDVSDTVDLRTPGLEKIRLTPKEVNNGEVRAALRRDFALLDADEDYLNAIGTKWETETNGGQCWLILHNYLLPIGYTIGTATLALLIPSTYPKAQVDMFFVYPPLAKADGSKIAKTQTQQSIRGLSFQRWSRHRGPSSKWDPRHDNVITHLALVESAIAKEVGQ